MNREQPGFFVDSENLYLFRPCFSHYLVKPKKVAKQLKKSWFSSYPSYPQCSISLTSLKYKKSINKTFLYPSKLSPQQAAFQKKPAYTSSTSFFNNLVSQNLLHIG
jgi:hypothetical protein